MPGPTKEVLLIFLPGHGLQGMPTEAGRTALAQAAGHLVNEALIEALDASTTSASPSWTSTEDDKKGLC
jgi:hypothetical protein